MQTANLQHTISVHVLAKVPALTISSCVCPCSCPPTLSSESLYADVDTNCFFEDVSCCLTITERGCEKACSHRDLTLVRTAGVREMSEDHNKMLRSPSGLWLKFNRCWSAAFMHLQDTEGQVNPTSRTSPVCLPPVFCACSNTWLCCRPLRPCSYSAAQREKCVLSHSLV